MEDKDFNDSLWHLSVSRDPLRHSLCWSLPVLRDPFVALIYLFPGTPCGIVIMRRKDEHGDSKHAMKLDPYLQKLHFDSLPDNQKDLAQVVRDKANKIISASSFNIWMEASAHARRMKSEEACNKWQNAMRELGLEVSEDPLQPRRFTAIE